MKKIFLFFLVIISAANFIYGQPGIQWQKSYGGSSDDGGFGIQKTGDGGYIILGNTASNDGDVSFNHGVADIWLVKIDSLGTLQWQRTIGGNAVDNALSLYQVPGGGYLIGSQMHSNNNGDVSSTPHPNDIWVVRLDSLGFILWQKFYGGNRQENFFKLQSTSDLGIIIGGSTYSNDGDVNRSHGELDFWIVKTDSVGTIQWQRALGGSDYDELLDIKQTADGGYIASGTSMSSDGDVTMNHGSSDYWIVKLDKNGILQWQKSLGGTSGEGANSILQRADGGYVVVGITYSNDGDISMSYGDGDCWIVWLDADGTIETKRSLGGSGEDCGITSELTSDGGFIVASVSSSSNGDATQCHGGYDSWIVKFDNARNIQWQKSFGGSKDEYPISIKQVTDSTYIFTGWSDSRNGDVTSNKGFNDMWVVKLGPVASPLPVELLSFTAELNSSQMVELNWSTASETNNDFFTIERSGDAKNFETLKIIDGAGNSTITLNYSSQDEHPLTGISYYRLKQTDFDGKFDYSETVAINNSSQAFNIFPNPSDGDKINITYSGNKNELNQISIYDSKGMEVFSKIYSNSTKENKISIVPENKLSAGIYLVSISTKYELIQQKLIVN